MEEELHKFRLFFVSCLCCKSPGPGEAGARGEDAEGTGIPDALDGKSKSSGEGPGEGGQRLQRRRTHRRRVWNDFFS